jgi:hypothetical protein
MTVGDFRKLKNFFSEWIDMREIVTYQITEKCSCHNDTYEVKNLFVEMEDGVIWFEDLEDVILSKDKSRKGFLISSAELVDYHKDQLSIKLKDGMIKIKVIK